MKIKIKLICFLLFLFSCTDSARSNFTLIDQELSELRSPELKREYLEKINQHDQKFRQGQSSEAMLKHGKNSSEYLEFIEKSKALDLENLYKVERYFLKFGYPSKNELGEEAALTPWIIIHHSASYEDRERNFRIIYQAYLDGNIDSAALTMYLGRMYEMKNHERLRLENPYTADEEINTLITKLQLEKEK